MSLVIFLCLSTLCVGLATAAMIIGFWVVFVLSMIGL